eukprot:CAMPEP_0172738574 /NCGR_PEP_ID=MMETSP1074-20121228/120500_1 /TAXON_ID=2916 /ORGANISM="Ceratium fusus, Strain PA161109" /LENGTH=139 /DNA_ID=CAMNT_0013568225 /DNA_START=454 /DNA_END=873 /DNA_ORIENTATION=-
MTTFRSLSKLTAVPRAILPLLHTNAITQVTTKFTFVCGNAPLKAEDAATMCTAVEPLPYIGIPIAMLHLPVATCTAITPLPKVCTAIRPDLSAQPITLSIHPLPGVRGSCFEFVSRPTSASLIVQLRRPISWFTIKIAH